MIWEALRITRRANTWGDEIYFEIPVRAEQAPDGRADVEVDELGYWPLGRAFCIFFGPTPVSAGNQPRAASPSTSWAAYWATSSSSSRYPLARRSR